MIQSRTHNCNELRECNVGEKVRIVGWFQNLRELGENLNFAVVRDFYGITQVVISDEEMLKKFKNIPRESTIGVDGIVRLRSSVNKDIPTGYIEIEPDNVEVLGKCTESLPFEIQNSQTTKDEVRLKYRFLDLRNPKVKDNIVLRSNVVSEIRKRMVDAGFLEITTPILTCSSPEGARDYLVPSRVHPGQFYALPQAPQQFKQILMASGIDRYFQIAPCFRDEDARADRSPGEFYQLDMEMAFATQEDIFNTIEAILPPVFEKYSKWQCSKPPFKRIKYLDSMEIYGSDKPDLRISLVVSDVSQEMSNCIFDSLNTQTVKAVVIPNFSQSRKYIDNFVEELDKKSIKVYWVRTDENMNFTGGISKYLVSCKEALIEKLDLKPNAFVAFVAGKKPLVQKSAGVIRAKLGEDLGFIDKEKFEFAWIIDFPMYEMGEESGKLEFCHNPFSMPQGGMEALKNMNPLDILAYQYDITCNGIELSSGAVRNHDPEIMIKAFEMVGLSASVVEEKFPAMYNAFKFGAPPHAGIAPGIDRMVMLIANEPNIREIITFPMNNKAQDLMMGAPSPVEQTQLNELNLMIKEKEK